MNINSGENTQDKVEVKHFNIAYTYESLIIREKEIGEFGSIDQVATEQLQNYYLPNQSYTTHKGITVVRALIDPEEYLVKLDKGNGLPVLLRNVEETHALLSTKGYTRPWTPFDIVVGDPIYPASCYRFNLLEINQSADNANIIFQVQLNAEHEKSKDVWMSFSNTKLGDLEEDSEEEKSFTNKTALLNADEFTSTQHELIDNIDIAGLIALGTRTGNIIFHQREPDGMTRFFEDTAQIEVKSNDNVWIVSVDVEAVESYFKQIRTTIENKDLNLIGQQKFSVAEKIMRSLSKIILNFKKQK